MLSCDILFQLLAHSFTLRRPSGSAAATQLTCAASAPVAVRRPMFQCCRPAEGSMILCSPPPPCRSPTADLSVRWALAQHHTRDG